MYSVQKCEYGYRGALDKKTRTESTFDWLPVLNKTAVLTALVVLQTQSTGVIVPYSCFCNNEGPDVFTEIDLSKFQ
jgi:hypothetical protein